jgi:hypothetical protein
VQRERCPSAEACDLGRVVLRAWSHIQNGVMPVSGGYSEQPSKLMRLVDIAASERGKMIEAEQRAVESRSKNNGSKRR